jgi:hypothetical protein
LWDVGIVSVKGSVDWHSVWVIASEDFVEDKRVLTSVRNTAAPTGRDPGWVAGSAMYDATTGKLVVAVLRS